MAQRLAPIVLFLAGAAAILFGAAEMVENRPVPPPPPIHALTHDTGVDIVLADNGRVLARVEEIERGARFAEGRQIAILGSVLMVWAYGVRAAARPR
jgi:hypothetical protein